MRFFRYGPLERNLADNRRNRKRSIMTALGVFWGIFMLIVLLGAGMGLGRLFRAQLGGMSTNTVLLQSSRTSVPYKGMPTGRWWRMDNDDLEAVSKPRRGGVHLRRHLGQRTPLQLQRAQGRLSDDGIHARLPEDQPAEDHRRPLHQRGRHGAQAQGLRHRHAGAERPLSGRTRPDGQSHQGRRKLLHHHRRHAPRIVGHVVQRCRTHGRRPDLAGAADVRLRPHDPPAGAGRLRGRSEQTGRESGPRSRLRPAHDLAGRRKGRLDHVRRRDVRQGDEACSGASAC